MNKHSSTNPAKPPAGNPRDGAGKKGWASVLAAPFRVHRYREAHTRMLRAALCLRDCDD